MGFKSRSDITEERISELEGSMSQKPAQRDAEIKHVKKM